VEELELSRGSNLLTQTFRKIRPKLHKIPELLFVCEWTVLLWLNTPIIFDKITIRDINPAAKPDTPIPSESKSENLAVLSGRGVFSF
jgi:hypothetical protein